jgi:hypothetical protein
MSSSSPPPPAAAAGIDLDDVLSLLARVSFLCREQNLSLTRIQCLSLSNGLDATRGDFIPAAGLVDHIATSLHDNISRDPAFSRRQRERRAARGAGAGAGAAGAGAVSEEPLAPRAAAVRAFSRTTLPPTSLPLSNLEKVLYVLDELRSQSAAVHITQAFDDVMRCLSAPAVLLDHNAMEAEGLTMEMARFLFHNWTASEQRVVDLAEDTHNPLAYVQREMERAKRGEVADDRITVLPYETPNRRAIEQWFADNLHSWDADLLELDKLTGGEPLLSLAHQLFRFYSLLSTYDIPLWSFQNLLTSIQAGYRRENPFHNSLRAASVLHSLHCLLHLGGIAAHLGDLDIFAALLSAVFLDHQHDGLTASFHLAAGTSLALFYNGVSMHEQNSLATSFEVLLEQENNILTGLSRKEKGRLMASVRRLVLSSDMALHFDQLAAFRAGLPRLRREGVREQDILPILSVALKLADYAWMLKPAPQYMRLQTQLGQEYYKQGDREASIGLPISTFADRAAPRTKLINICLHDFIVKPVVEALVAVFPQIISLTNKHALSNRAMWGGAGPAEGQ